MEPDLLVMAAKAFAIIADPMRMLFLLSGVLMGLVLGIIPGLGGLVGLSILLPFTFSLDPFTALAMMLGLSAVTVTSDTIPAVLFSVPGTVGSAATILDGYPMSQKGEAGRALGAAFTASVLGGLFGALLLGVSIPIQRPLVLLIGSPEILAICIVGLSMVAALSGGAPLKGMAAVCIGLLIANIGEDPQTATQRWTFETNYLWDGVPIVPLALGLFALPEIADLVIARRTISGGDGNVGNRWAQLQGVRDVLRNWWLMLRCSSIGSLLGAIPGMGAAVIDWIAYGHAARTEKGASESFGKGDVRGVIASESSNNAKEGGALIPTIAFGVPGSASMALLLGAFLIHGINPGPDLLTKRLDVTYSMVWSVAIANIVGAGICFLFANQLAKIVLIRIGILAPLIVAVVFVGVFQASNSWGDLHALLAFALLGWIMKRMNWPRPPVILGFVLGGLIENYMFISIQRYAFEWLSFPIVLIMLALALIGVLRPTIRGFVDSRRKRMGGQSLRLVRPDAKDKPDAIFTVLVLALFCAILATSFPWPGDAKLMPWAVAWTGIAFAAMHLLGRFVSYEQAPAEAGPDAIQAPGGDGEISDLDGNIRKLPLRDLLARSGNFLGWLILYMVLTALIGLLPAMFVFLMGYMRIQGRESWKVSISIAVPTCAFAYIVFHQVVSVVWPKSYLGDWLPVLRQHHWLNFF